MARGRPSKKSKVSSDKQIKNIDKAKLEINVNTLYPTTGLTKDEIEHREIIYNDIVEFVKWIAPYFMLSHHHIEIFNFLTNPEAKTHQLMLIPRGHGKAQPLDRKVLTPKGWKTIGELKVGDYVIGMDGKPKKVIQLHPISEMDVYKVKTRDGRETECNLEHLWTVQCPSNTGKKLITKPLKDILKNYKSDRYDKRNGKYYVEYRYFLPTCKPIEFNWKELPVDPYVLGAWLGDGDSNGGGFTTADIEILDYIQQAGYKVTKRKSKYHYGIIGLTKQLKELNVLNNKHIPEEYLFASVEQRIRLLQGLMDTDGHCQQDGRRAEFSNKNKRLIDNFVALVRSLGGTATVGVKTINSEIYYVVTCRFPKGINPFRLKRKADLWKGSYKTKTAIVDIEYSRRTLARCITVEDGHYITDDYMVTHNSMAMAFYVVWRIIRDPRITILYASSTATLAEQQLHIIKNLLTQKRMFKYFKGLVHPEEGKREKWTQQNIKVDHPIRKIFGIRDDTITVAGVGKGITGLHFDLLILDDITAPNTDADPWSPTGREKVERWVSQAASILNAGGEVKVVGTRYHPKDIYNTLMEIKEPIVDEEGNIIDEVNVYEKLERVVEVDGEFLFPRRKHIDGKYYGFDWKVLNKIKAQYVDKTQFMCFHPDTLVYTDDGIKKIDDLQIGDKFNGNKVVNIFRRQQFGEAVELRVCGIPENIISTLGHKFPVRVKSYKKDYGIQELQLGDILNNKVKSLRFYLKHEFPTETIESKFDEDTWWLIGHYLAEGCKWKKYVCIVTRYPEEKGIHTKIKNILDKKNIHYFTQKQDSTMIWYIDWKELYDYLDEFGYYCYGKHLNYEAKRLNRSCSEALIDGYLKGDGYSLKQGGYGITSVNLKLLEDIKDVLLRLGHCPYIFKLYNAGSRKSFGYNVRTCYAIRWTPNSKRPKNFIEDGVYWQLINYVKPIDYAGEVITCEVENSHEYNVYGLVCKNSQYYNRPEDPENKLINPDNFQYYDKSKLNFVLNEWRIGTKPLRIYAALDIAATITKRSDYTALVVVGVDTDGFRYVLDIRRLKTDKISEIAEVIYSAWLKWRFIKLRAETTATQGLVINQLQEMMRQRNAIFSWDKQNSRTEKRVRIMSILEPLYSQKIIFHYKGGNCQILEDELISSNPAHDDVADALASCCELIQYVPIKRSHDDKIVFHPKFGGVV